MKITNILLTLLVSAGASQAFAKTYNCNGAKGVKGNITVKLTADSADVTGEYSYKDPYNGTEADRAFYKANCEGKKDNMGRIKKYDYFNFGKGCSAADYIRTDKNFTKKNEGWVSMVTAGPSDHDMSGYVYVSFHCTAE